MVSELEQTPFVFPAASIVFGRADADVFFLCEHASAFIPKQFNRLGLSPKEHLSHIGWDIGALQLAHYLRSAFDSDLIFANYSRLLYDCNRSPDRQDAMPTLVDGIKIAGNMSITNEQRKQRVDLIYHGFHDTVENLAAERNYKTRDVALVTVHSFTPVYCGERRTVEIGVLGREDNVFANDFYRELKRASAYDVQLNAPYRADDGVSHTVDRHGIKPRLRHVMIEVRNDLLATFSASSAVGKQLARALGVVQQKKNGD